MAYITIPALPAGSALTGLEEFEAVQSLTSVKLTATQIRAFTNTTPSFIVDDANLNGVSAAATFTHTVTGTPALGIGTSINFATEVAVGNVVAGSSIASVSTDTTLTQEDFALTFRTMLNGALGEKARITSDGFFGVNTTTPVAPVDATINDTSGSAVSVGLAVAHTTATPGTGIGTAIQFRASTGISTITDAVRLAAVATNITAGIESFDLVFSNTAAGSTNQEVARLTSTKRLGIGTTTPNTTIEAVREDASTNTVLSAARLTRTVAGAGAPSIGIGTALEFSTETQVNTNVVGAAIYTVSTSLVLNNEDFDLAISTVGSGALTEVVRITSTDRVGINTTTPQATLHAVTDNAALNTVISVARLTRTVSGAGSPGVGVGTGLDFETEAQIGTNRIGSSIQSVSTGLGTGIENFDLVFNTMTGGVAATEKLRVGSAVITPSIPFDFVGIGVAPSPATTRLEIATNSLTISPLHFDTDTPTLLTTAQAGSFDFNGDALYFTPQGIERGVLPSRMVYVNTAGTRLGPNATNAPQTVTVTAGSSTLSVAAGAVPGAAVGNTGCLAIFSAVTAPTNITLNQPYWVNFLTTTTFTISATQGGTPITPSTAGATVTVIFHFPILGNGLSSVGLRLSASTRYMYELYFTISHTSANATSVAYALTNQTGTLSAHYYRVTSQNSTAAFATNLTGLAATSSNLISNFVTSGFNTFVTVTGVTAALANTTNLVKIEGQIDTLTACTYVIPTIGFPVAPTLSTIFQGAYMSIYPVGPVVSNTSVGSWES